MRPGGRTTGRAALYLPGGSYIHPMAPQQWRFVERLAAAGVQVVVARYGLAPQHTYRDAYPFVTEAYRRLVARVGAESTTILGDSAGGGLALGLAQTLPESSLPQPRLLMLLAPWVDLTLEDPAITPVEADDPWLTRIGLVEAGRAWAGGDDPRQPRLSPIHGSVEGLAPIHTYVGTRDVLSPDVLRLQHRFEAAGARPRPLPPHGGAGRAAQLPAAAHPRGPPGRAGDPPRDRRLTVSARRRSPQAIAARQPSADAENASAASAIGPRRSSRTSSA